MKTAVNHNYIVISTIIFLIIILSGCSGKASFVDPPLPYLSGEKVTNASESSRMLLGTYDLIISDDLTHAEILPVRDLHQIGDSWTTELSQFFINNPCRDCFRINGVSIDELNRVVIEFYIRHPFGPGDPILPPTARNRDDVRIFDARLVIAKRLGDGPEFFGGGKKLSNTLVVNADGYTEMIDPVYDRLDNRDESIHPYVVLFEDSSVGNVDPGAPTGFTDLRNASGHNVFNQGAESLKEVKLNLVSGQSYPLRLYILANYGQSTIDFTHRLNPKYYLPEFNAKEPWKVEVVVESNSLAPSRVDSKASLLVRVWDWQHGANIDPSLSSLNSIRASSNVTSVEIDIPELLYEPKTKTTPDIGGTGRGESPLEYRFEIYNDKAAPDIDLKGLVRVKDSRQTRMNVSLPEDLIYNSGLGLLEFDIPEFTTYQYFELDFNTSTNVPPIANFTSSPSGDPLLAGLNDQIQLDATGSYDIDGSIQTYQWDFNYDRETFRPQSGYTSAVTSWQYSAPGIYRLAMRVTDNGIPQLSDITYKWVIIHGEPSLIEPRLIGSKSNSIDNLKYPSRNAIRTYGSNIYVPVGGFPTGTRYMLASNDYGNNFSEPIQVSYELGVTSTQHTGAMDVSSNGIVSFLYFDEVTPNPISWMILGKSPDGTTWGPGASLRSSTDNDYVTDGQFVYGQNDHEFSFFESITDFLSGTPKNYMNYIHRTGPPASFQDRPIVLEQSALPSTERRFENPVAAVDSNGYVHLAYAKYTRVDLIIAPYSLMYAKIAPDGSMIEINPKMLYNQPNRTAKKHMAIAADGSNIYVIFSNYNTLTQYSEISLLRSTDSGATWSDPIMISDTQVPAVGVEHPMNIAIDNNSKIHVVWVDTRQSQPFGNRNIWYDYSDDSGLTWHQDKMLYGQGIAGDQSFPGIAIDDLNRVHVVWWNNDAEAGQGVWHTRFITPQ